MADISFVSGYGYDDNGQDEDGGNEEGSEEMTLRQDELDNAADELTINPDEFLPPVLKLQKYADSDIIFNRQVVARSILDTLRSVVSNRDDVESIMTIVLRLSDDAEPSVRAELMEQIPTIASFCQEQNGHLRGLVSQHLVPIIVKYLTDINNQVRKAAQIALLLLLEQQLVDKGQLEQDICPLVLQLTEEDNMDDQRTEAVALMSKMARLVGKEVTEQVFLDRFASLCLDASFHVRKVCATNFGEFCAVVGRDTTQGVLLAKFYHLCDDSIWGVRKACADVFMPVSCICSMEIRQSDLAPLFVNLLCDQSKWVRTAAFQALGPFISTFADPNKTCLCYDEDGIRVLQRAETMGTCESPEDVEGEVAATEETEQEEVASSVEDLRPGGVEDFNRNVSLSRRLSGPPLTTVSRTQNHLHVHLENAFDNFQFWRVPIPELELDIDLAEGRPTSIQVRAKVHAGDVYTSNLNVQFRMPSESGEPAGDDPLDAVTTSMRCARLGTTDSELAFMHGDNMIPMMGGSTFGINRDGSIFVSPDFNEAHRNFMQLVDLKRDVRTFSIEGNNLFGRDHQTPLFDQDIVPSELLEHYLSMTDTIKAQVIDPEVARFCAYSFPAVALTLGRKHWPCLRSTFKILASDMRWKVRRTLASSMHELAVILGSELAAKELLPIFEGFMQDLDEVRIGILHHLARFLKLLRPSERRSFLPQLTNFLKLDNERNWRFRLTLAEQMMEMVDLYSPSDVKEFLVPISLLLVQDRVCEVRQATLQLVAIMLRRIGQSPDPLLLKGLLSELIEQFIRAHKWSVRQTFALLCEQLVLEGSVSEEQFALDVLPHLLSLCWDSVANVRLAVARCISHTLFATDYFSRSQNPHHGVLVEALQILQQDGDRDVRFFAHLPPPPP